jgi:hypothetical protein
MVAGIGVILIFKKIWLKLLVFVAIVTAGQLIFFQHYNTLFATAQAETKVTLQKLQKPKKRAIPVKTLIKQEVARLNAQYQFVQVSPNGQYATYLDKQNELHIEDLKSKKDVSHTTGLSTVQYVSWISNQKLFVGEQTSPGCLELITVDESDGAQTAVVPTFGQLSPGASFAKISFSRQTNDIYILINTKTSSALYHIGTMAHVTAMPTDGRFIKDMDVSFTGDKLYFEDNVNFTDNVLYFVSNDELHTVKLNAALITVVGNVVYYGDVNKDGMVTDVYRMDENGDTTLVSTLDQPTSPSQIEITADGKVENDASSTTVGLMKASAN